PMRSLLSVILPPGFDLASRVVETGEPVSVQAFIPQPTIEAFHVGILHRLARLNELQAHSPFFAPRSQRPTTKFRSVVQDDSFRPSSCADDPVQHPPHSQPAQRSIDLDGRTLSRALIHNGQHPNHFPRAHAIAHEIYGPAFIRSGGGGSGHHPLPMDPPSCRILIANPSSRYSRYTRLWLAGIP